MIRNGVRKLYGVVEDIDASAVAEYDVSDLAYVNVFNKSNKALLFSTGDDVLAGTSTATGFIDPGCGDTIDVGDAETLQLLLYELTNEVIICGAE